ncbi:MAG TPA: hypothetical protein QF703_01985 [Candidatus Thalassarchaeaceae archaeon]|nr:hypothetical protein [Candidatus Thalassarchaeaceae archaeon]
MKDRVVVGTLDLHDCIVHSKLSNNLDTSEFEDLEISFESLENFPSGLAELSEGRIDLFALPAILAYSASQQIAEAGCEVIGARTPRQPSMVLVSPNRLPYQPKSAIIVTDSELVRRQLLRARPDLTIMDPGEIEGISSGDPSDLIERSRLLAEALKDDLIQGFVISRAEYDNSRQTERRHSLTSQPEERGGSHFLPKPFSDLIAIVGRAGFPKSISSRLSEPEGNTALWIQSRVISDMNKEIAEQVGVQVRHRHVGTLLRQAERDRDLVLGDACVDPDGEVRENAVRVEIRVEALSSDGRRTIGLDRITTLSEYEFSTISFIKDWSQLLRETTRDVPKDHSTDPDSSAFIY